MLSNRNDFAPNGPLYHYGYPACDPFAPDIKPPTEAVFSSRPSCDSIRCPCGASDYEEPDVAMIFCDSCNTWQHTVCCGYYSNSDKRIPSHEGSTHTCYNCQHKKRPKVLKFCSDLSLVRRALFISFNLSITDHMDLATRLGTTFQKSSHILKKLANEGFLLKVPSNGAITRFSYECIKSNEIKKKIKYYFSVDLATFPEYHKALGKPVPSPAPISSLKHSLFEENHFASDGCSNVDSFSRHDICSKDESCRKDVASSKSRSIEPLLKKKKQSSSTENPIKCFLKN